MRRSICVAALGLGLALGLAAACGSSPPAAAPALSNRGGGPSPAPHVVMVTLERTACYGWCPVYTLTVYRDGAVEYQGTNFVKVKGKATDRLSPDQLAALDKLFTDNHYFALEDAYEHYEMTDQPGATTSYRAGDRSKTIRHYHGDSHAPPALRDVEDGIDRIVHTERWIGTRAERDKLFGGG
jgi:Domain of unknown function (DUF6438)